METLSTLITVNERGLRCEAGDFTIDPWRPVDTALITHAHADHSRPGSKHYIATRGSEPIMRARLGQDISLRTVDYGEKLKLGEVWVSFHPAGHVLGSAQIRVEKGEDVWVISGDYKRDADPTCAPFELVECGTFVTEATFGYPVYTWEPSAETARQIYEWWSGDPERATILFCYAFGKAQRVLAELLRFTDKPVYLHGAVTRLTRLYRELGVSMLPTRAVSDHPKGHDFAGELIIAPPSAHRSAWMKRFKLPQTGFASGWMLVRGNRRRRGYERGFVLSDHVDWPGLIRTVDETGAHTVLPTHGQTAVVARYLRETRGLNARPLETLYEDEGEAPTDDLAEAEDTP